MGWQHLLLPGWRFWWRGRLGPCGMSWGVRMSEVEVKKVERLANLVVAIVSVIALVGAPIITYQVAVATLDSRVSALEASQAKMTDDLKQLTINVRDISVMVARIEERVSARNGATGGGR